MRLSKELISSYFAIYLPTRFNEWYLIGFIITLASRKLATSASSEGHDALLRQPMVIVLLWVLGGVLLSCLLDTMMIGLEKNFSR